MTRTKRKYPHRGFLPGPQSHPRKVSVHFTGINRNPCLCLISNSISLGNSPPITGKEVKQSATLPGHVDYHGPADPRKQEKCTVGGVHILKGQRMHYKVHRNMAAMWEIGMRPKTDENVNGSIWRLQLQTLPNTNNNKLSPSINALECTSSYPWPEVGPNPFPDLCQAAMLVSGAGFYSPL